MAKIQPLGDRVVAEPLQAAEKTQSGIYIPEDAKSKPELAKVVSVGKDVAEIKAGDVILHDAFSTKKVDDQEYVIVKEKEVLAIVK